ncbi:AAA family ATPase [Candidatus Woesearchaeota archaeon]|nr:AAA family ATPase [Candidatus Woesearchaeota archaeon]
MLIKKIKLKNIRSYEEEEIKFNRGINLLSGNIGCGKSTILISIEFALFGLLRGDLSGSTLLRNGKDSGYVVLDFELNNKFISIKRSLKKTNSAILQDQCFLTVNDVTQQFTSTEIKQKILELINYPADTLTKKSMVYRYTVYTPQEDMKSILSGEKELRLETLRKVFNMDKYKRIKENCKIISSELKNKKKESAAFIYDLEQKKDKLNNNRIKNNELKLKLNEFELKIVDYNKNIELSKTEIKKIENEILILNNIKKDLEIISSSLKIKNESKIKNIRSYEQLLKELSLTTEVNLIDIQQIKNKINEINKIIINEEIKLKEIVKNSIETKSKISHSHEIKNKIIDLDLCPLCEQEVSIEHKNKINEREDSSINEMNKKISSYLETEKATEIEIQRIKNSLEELKLKEREYEINKIKLENTKYKKELSLKLSNDLGILEKELELLNFRKSELTFELNKFNDLDNNYKNSKLKSENLYNDLKKLEIEKASLSQEYKSIEKINSELIKEIEDKEKVKEKLQYYIEMHDWFDVFFISLMDNVERKVMLKIHNIFNNLFQNWFSMLMDIENIKVKLDEKFTPIINQNGYDLEYENLSGGEKTACALSYRLALNQTINNLISDVATRDMIILDEPTDGFSTEQLDRLKEVLNELKMNQVIIVSHESKIETFVDSIIKIEKQNHISKVIS